MSDFSVFRKKISTSTGEFIDPDVFLPTGGNFKTSCLEAHVVAVLPSFEKPKYAIMTCFCPGGDKYYKAQIKYRISDDWVSTNGDGKLYVEKALGAF